MSEPAAVLEASTLDRDVLCVDCGYNLRGLSPRGDCPECGCAVRLSLREDRLADAPPAWRRRLRRGAHLLAGALVLLPVVNVLPAVVLGWGAWRPSMTVVQAGAALAWGVNLVLLGVAVAGLWLLTAREPDRAEPTADWRPRVVARSALGAWALLTLGVAAAVGVVLTLTNRRLHADWWIYDGVLIAAAGAFAVGMVACWSHLAILADRVPDPPLVRRLRQLRLDWIAAVVLGLLAAGAINVINWLAAASPGGGAGGWRATAPVVVAGMVAVVLIWLWARTTIGALRLTRTMRTLGRG